MSKLYLNFLLLFMIGNQLQAQFAPPAGQAGTDAIHADSSCFINWATICTLERGLIQIDKPELGYADYGTEASATGKADNNVVSLGDGGEAVLQFAFPLWNGPGPDFAVFENTFTDEFLELAFVAVSSDGINYFRFPSVSLTAVDEQVGSFGSLDATKIHLLAGKYRSFYGVPFDLDSIADNPLLDKMAISHIAIKDVVGKLDVELGSFDSRNQLINDPWPTPFPSSGFDLDAVGVIHDASNLAVDEKNGLNASFYPNPFVDQISLKAADQKQFSLNVYDSFGKIIFESTTLYSGDQIATSGWKKGLYLIQIKSANNTSIFKMLKL
ncbi:MAG: T9SS type A sorting domain-containing protein [Bacteroidales bacterium]|nr:T9SS type A sorting domain-containing protein [Bacteroidales bacterium]